MAISVSIRDLSVPSTTSKTVSLDLISAVTVTSEGDERFLLTASPGAGTTAANSTTISPVIIEHFKAGYARSSGFKLPPFNITSSNNKLNVSIDGGTAREITLTSGTGLSGSDIAMDMQDQINNLAISGASEAGNLAYLNALVSFENNKFVIIAGSVSSSFTGASKSSVAVTSGSSNSAHTTLGFDVFTTSESIAGHVVSETLTSDVVYDVSGATIVPVQNSANFEAGQAFSIYDGSSRQYFVATSVSGSNLVTYSGAVATTFSGGSVVQNIFERDPDGELASPYTTTDDIVRFGLRTIAAQVAF